MLFSFFLNIMSLFQYYFGKASTEYMLSVHSEDYNTVYLFHKNILTPILNNKIQYIPILLPQSFVVEIGGLVNGDQAVLIYNDNTELKISKKANHYYVDRVILDEMYEVEKKISFYFVNNKILLYIDDNKVFEKRTFYDSRKKVGIKWVQKKSQSNQFLNCYLPLPFQQVNYGEAFEIDSDYQNTAGTNIPNTAEGSGGK